MNISILGCGWYGSALGSALVKAGHGVKGSTTSAQKLETLAAAGMEPYLVNFLPDDESYDKAFFNCDVLLIAIPPKSRSGEGDIFMDKVKRIINAVKLHQVKNVIFISSTGVYADLNTTVTEDTPPVPNSAPGKILLEAENLFRAESTFRTTIIRFGGLTGPGRNPGRFFAGKTQIPNGKAPVNLIHLDDCIGLTETILVKQAFGYLFNACSPRHQAKADFYTREALNSGFEAPQFIDELKEWKIVASSYVKPVLSYQYKVIL